MRNRPKRKPEQFAAVHAAADYYEALFAARFVRAMKRVQAQVSINDLALSLGNVRQAQRLVTTHMVTDALSSCATVNTKARRKGGQIGAVRVRDLGKRQ